MDFDRNLYPELVKALSLKQAIVITGMRRVGKTTAARFLLDKFHSGNKKYFDLERIEIRSLFSDTNYERIVQALELEGLDFSKKACVALDEIQLVPNITSVVKYLYDTYPVKFILTGSSSFYLKNLFTESLAGRKQLFVIHPLSFDEFLRFKKFEGRLPAPGFVPFNRALYEKLRLYYEEFIEYGGFPQVVLAKIKKEKVEILKDILNSYLQMDIRFFGDFTKSDELYRLMKLLAPRAGNRIDFTKLGSVAGIDRKKIKEYILFFEQTFIIRMIPAYSKSADREIAGQKKLYFTDTGILNTLGNPGSGALFENAIANQLAQIYEVAYYTRKTGQEIDFILDKKTAIEVKESPSASDLEILRVRAKSTGLSNSFLIGRHWNNTQFTDFTWGGSIY